MLKTTVWEVYGKLPWEQGPIIWAVPWTAFVPWAKLISLSIQKELIAVWNPWKFFMHQKNQQTTEMGCSFLDLLGYCHRGSPAKCCTKKWCHQQHLKWGSPAAKLLDSPQVADVRNAGHLVAATPGRLLDVMDSSTLLTPTLSHCHVKDIFFGTVLVPMLKLKSTIIHFTRLAGYF